MLLGAAVAVLLVIVEVFVVRSYQDAQRTTRDLQQTTDTTTGIANVQRETLLLQVQIHQMTTGGRDDLSSTGVELRRGLLDRQIDVVMAASVARPKVKREMERIRSQAVRFDKALAAYQAARSMTARNALRASVERLLNVMTAQVKRSFDDEEHALHGALNRTLHERATTQEMLAAVSVLAALLALALAIAIWRVVRRDFEPAYRAELDERLEHAVERGEFELHYQPIIGLADGAVAGLEALIRWRHPRRGLLIPAQFLPSAEGSGHMSAIGRWVLAQACADAASWVGDAHSPAPWVSVNVAASQFKDATLVSDVARALGETGLAPDRLVLEMSEWTSLAYHKDARGALREIADLGARIALDDFGTGYTALSSLRVGAIHILKLDKSLVDGIAGNDEQGCIVEAFVDLARTLGLETVAEGIEDADQLEALRGLGCDYGQGFHLGRPLAPGKLSQLMASRRGELAAAWS